MILVLGSSLDKVYPKFMEELRASGAKFAVVDEDCARQYRVEAIENGRTFYRSPAPRSERNPNGADDSVTVRRDLFWRVSGDGCLGSRPVGAIFVRHAVARTLDPDENFALGALQNSLNRMLLSATCPSVNPPAHALSNYSKPYQLHLLASAGFDVPRTLVTNVPAEARRFVEECGGRVIFKGASNVMSFAQVLNGENASRLDLLPNSPTQFQEFVEGVDYRVHVVGDRAYVTRLASDGEDYRRTALVDRAEIRAEPATLPESVIERSIRFTRSLGLVVGGIDFKESPSGRLVALELNPYPQFTFYEGRSGQPITRGVVEYLIQSRAADSNVFA